MNFFADLSIARKLIGSFAAIIAVMIGTSVIGYNKLTLIEKSNDLTTRTYLVLEVLGDTMAAMVDQESAVRGYLISGDTQFLESYRNGQVAFNDALVKAHNFVTIGAQQTRFDELRDLGEAWRTKVAEKEIALMAKPETVDQAHKMAASGVGKASMDGIRRAVAAIDKNARDILDTRVAGQAEAFSTSYTASWAGCLVAIVFSGLVTWMLSRSIASPLVRMVGAMGQLAKGDLKVEIPGQKRGDEIGLIAKSVQTFKDFVADAERQRADQESQKTRLAAANRQSLLTLADAFEAKVGKMVELVASSATELQSTAQSMTGIASETTHQTTSVVTAAEQASANVETVAAAAEELSSSISEISRQVAQSAKITGLAVEDSRRTDGIVRALAEGAQKIGEVVGLISNIAGQTNLLALNATIEAARAGDAGKGFAVVASEVKSLANQTAKATEQISQQIASIQAATKSAVDSIQNIGTRISEVSEIATAIGAAVEEQGAATQEIARNVQQAAQGTQQVTSTMSGLSEGANNTGAAATQVLGAAGELSRQAEQLNGEVNQFIAELKAA